jgi:hypothetical protein
MSSIATLRRIAAAALASGIVIGGVLLAAPASAATSTQYIERNTASWCQSELAIAIALHRAQGNFVSASNGCTYSGYSHTWLARVHYN